MRPLLFPLVLILALLTAGSLYAEEWAPPDDLLSTPQPNQAQPLSDENLLRAYHAWQAGNLPLLDALAEAARGPLADYPRYWALERHLEQGTTYMVPDMQNFFRDYPNSTLVPLLRHQWLSLLGQNQNWKTFEAQFTSEDRQHANLLCYHWQALFAGQDESFFDDALHYWHSTSSWPSTCDPVFRQMVAAHRITPTDLWNAMRQALARNQIRQARYINSFFPPFEGLNENDLNLAEGRPQQFLDETPPIDGATRMAQREIWLYALERLAGHHPQEAVDMWRDIAPHLSPEDRRFGWQQLALQGAMQLVPEANDWFHQTDQLSQDPPWLAWKARAALHAEDWASVLEAIDAMPVEEAEQPAWRYWKARARQATHHESQALPLWRALSDNPSYYGLLAQEELNLPLVLPGQPNTSLRTNPTKLEARLERPLRLYRLGLLNEARREWISIEPGLSPSEHLEAARLAFRLGWYDRSIHSAEHATGLPDLTLIFPTPYANFVEKAANRFNLTDSWIYAIIRQESRFFTIARSSTGAQGLMQLMPATARWAARRIGLSRYRQDEANQPDTNILLGSFYFGHLQQLLSSPILATIGYNAGPLRAQRWAAVPFSEPDIFLENIPFDETRDYVQQVLYNEVIYQKRLHPETPLHLHDLLHGLALAHP